MTSCQEWGKDKMDYLEFFALKEDPFRLTPDPFYFYPSESHNEALSSLNYMIEQKEGFFLVTGECGTGKTTLLNTFLNTNKWKDRTVIAMVLTPRLSPEEFLLTVLEDLNVKIRNTNKNEIIKAFRDFLIENSMLGKTVVIIVDEAQNLPDETLEELRLLSNLETEKEKLIQIVLVGQPELRKRLLLEELKQLSQRITVRAELRPLTETEISDYINYRLIKAGKGSVSFDDKAKKLILKLSKGVPRLINLISSRAMMAAYLDTCLVIRKRHVMYAVRHVSDSHLNTDKRTAVVRYALATVLLISAVAVLIINITSDLGGKTLPAAVVAPPQPVTKSADIGAKDGAPVEKEKMQKKGAIVTADAANIRENPSLDSGIITSAPKGTEFEIVEELIGREGDKWYRVVPSEGREGWISGKVVELSGNN